MKRIIALMIIFTLAFSVNTFAAKYSAETQRLMEEARLGQDNSLEEIMQRQEEYKKNKAKSTPTQNTGVNGANRTLRSSNDEFRVVTGGGNQSVKVTNTPDELHIYSNEYANSSQNYGAIFSNDELHTVPKEAEANDGYGKGGFDELHINENFRQNVWQPDHKINRLTIDEFRLPSDM